LKDCQGNVIFKGKEGKSREKEYQGSLRRGVKECFSSLNEAPYKYDSTIVAVVQPQQVAATPAGAAPAAATAAASSPRR